jgi:molybdopterin-guanine dinucleotide biosynthesis protein A
MGRDKAKVRLAGKILLDHVLDALVPQVSQVILVGGEPDLAQLRGLTHLADAIPGGRGPLAGVLSALEWAAEAETGKNTVFICAVDMPCLPDWIEYLLKTECRNS